ncbi:6-phosphogluconolactonase [Rothia sp. AR01]|uniref:6-phosphogluconolactonase n=1 Tax=Rothia santali TaxID=2949643 RepID=A0A9X2HCU8_9MICC|nr:6-phosphogluconolactonase [Rothia santali]MCP3424502.1 6-phosphogluconolactonase [Rothia santali]
MPERHPLTVVHPDKDRLREATGARIVLALADALAERETVHVSLTGGSMGIAVWEAVASSPLAELVAWDRVHFWWSDERFLPTGDGDRNAQQAFDAFLGGSAVPAGNIHVMGSSDEFPDQHRAAEVYAAELAEWAEDGAAAPRFDLTLLGMGPDGHMASLFPGREEILEDDAAALGIEDSPKPPPGRVTLTLPLINGSERVWFLVAGQDKAPALGRVLDVAGRAATVEELRETPAAGAHGIRETLYLVTRDAVGEAGG